MKLRPIFIHANFGISYLCMLFNCISILMSSDTLSSDYMYTMAIYTTRNLFSHITN